MSYKVVLVALIHRNNCEEIFLVKRNREPGYGMWSLIGGVGALEKEKDPGRAIKIEIEGEFGVEFINYSLLDVKFEDSAGSVLHFYYQGQFSAEPKKFYPPTTKEMRWFSLEEAIKTPIAFEDRDKEMIKRLRNKSCFSK